ncbi:MAG: glycosyltransferase family 4 protein [Ginsengibacter sp.]|jgi:glycosyltransferase involved in cell wall biosynthesis
MPKKTIIHVIYHLGRGGAETMLVQVLKELPEYNNIVVTFYENNHFKNELVCDEHICLHKRSLWWLPIAAFNFRKIIKNYKPDLVHSHLPIPNFMARMSTPRGIPLITTIHTSLSFSSDYKKWHLRCLDKLTYRLRKSIIVAVSEFALNDYFNFLKLKPFKTYVLHTFVNEKLFTNKVAEKRDTKKFKLISVGALREGKNYAYLLQALKTGNYKNIEVHIFGSGPLHDSLTKEIKESNLPVLLKGQVNNIETVLGDYDLFIMPSRFEGFSLSVLEAMSTRLPLLLSDIPSFKEQCGDCATYFDLSETLDFNQKLNYLIEHPEERFEKASRGFERVTHNFTLARHMTDLKEIYFNALNDMA